MVLKPILIGAIVSGVIAAISFGFWLLNIFHGVGRVLLVVWVLFGGLSLALGLYGKGMGYTLVYKNGQGGKVTRQMPFTDCQECIYNAKTSRESCFCRDCGLFQ